MCLVAFWWHPSQNRLLEEAKEKIHTTIYKIRKKRRNDVNSKQHKITSTFRSWQDFRIVVTYFKLSFSLSVSLSHSHSHSQVSLGLWVLFFRYFMFCYRLLWSGWWKNKRRKCNDGVYGRSNFHLNIRMSIQMWANTITWVVYVFVCYVVCMPILICIFTTSTANGFILFRCFFFAFSHISHLLTSAFTKKLELNRGEKRQILEMENGKRNGKYIYAHHFLFIIFIYINVKRDEVMENQF